MKKESNKGKGQPASMTEEPCNESKCVNCFENHGYIYEPYRALWTHADAAADGSKRLDPPGRSD